MCYLFMFFDLLGFFMSLALMLCCVDGVIKIIKDKFNGK